MSWRVDGLPFQETRSFEGDGAVLPHARSAKLLSEMLRGKRLTVRFNEPQKGRRIERTIPLDGFTKAYAAYRKLHASKPPQPGKLSRQARAGVRMAASNPQCCRNDNEVKTFFTAEAVLFTGEEFR